MHLKTVVVMKNYLIFKLKFYKDILFFRIFLSVFWMILNNVKNKQCIRMGIDPESANALTNKLSWTIPEKHFSHTFRLV